MTLDQWCAANRVEKIYSQSGRIGVYDERKIDHVRTWLWDLEDFAVESIAGGVIWFRPVATFEV